jgi:hypothetical protein
MQRTWKFSRHILGQRMMMWRARRCFPSATSCHVFWMHSINKNEVFGKTDLLDPSQGFESLSELVNKQKVPGFESDKRATHRTWYSPSQLGRLPCVLRTAWLHSPSRSPKHP